MMFNACLLQLGGTLLFDDQDLHLNAEIILITDGGKLQVIIDEFCIDNIFGQFYYDLQINIAMAID